MLGPVRSMEYLGGDDVLFLGQVFGIYSDMEALDYLTIVSLKYGDTSYDCNYLWPFNLYEAAVVARDAIIVSADYRRVCRWDGVSGTTVMWQKMMDIPAYIVTGAKDSILAIAEDRRTAYTMLLSDGSVKESMSLPFEAVSRPASLGSLGFAVAGKGAVALLSWEMEILSELHDVRIEEGCTLIPDHDSLIMSGRGFVAKIGL